MKKKNLYNQKNYYKNQILNPILLINKIMIIIFYTLLIWLLIYCIIYKNSIKNYGIITILLVYPFIIYNIERYIYDTIIFIYNIIL